MPRLLRLGVAAPGEQDRQFDAVLGEVGSLGVAQLRELPARRPSSRLPRAGQALTSREGSGVR
jgi:hypothetical protein